MFIIKKSFLFTCDDCGHQSSFSNLYIVSDVRKFGWAISKDYKKCYCPSCANKHRHTGRPSFFSRCCLSDKR